MKKGIRSRTMVEDRRQLAEFLHFRMFTIVAHDWGGAAAWEFAIVHPGYLDKLVIIDAPHPALFTHATATNPEQQKASRYMAFFRSVQAEPVLSADHYAKFVDLVMGSGLKTGAFTEADKEEYLNAWLQPT
jgi:pimeloyl-ACP methyl ester carboxylesterase